MAVAVAHARADQDTTNQDSDVVAEWPSEPPPLLEIGTEEIPD